MSNELDRWARERAPDVLARAEAEAIALLRDALVRAATGTRTRAERTVKKPPVELAEADETGELLWAYCVQRDGDVQPADLSGVDPKRPVERIQAAGLAALVSRVPRREFGPEPLRRNLNELAWLERVARAHETVLERTLAAGTIVPLRLCTLYESEESVKRMLETERAALSRALDLLDGRQEMGVKVLVEDDRLRAQTDDIGDLEQEVETRGSGGAYMLRRRLERQIRERADSLAREISDSVHARFQDWAVDAVTRPPQNPELSGHEGAMVLNAAYLVQADRVDGLRELAANLQSQHEQFGVTIEVTGPWPPYNFVPGGAAEGIA